MAASASLTRRLDWSDTDAAGYWHHSTFWTYAEAGEAALMRSLGLSELAFGHTPRRKVTAEFHRPVYFDDEVTIAFEVERLGRTSATYAITVTVTGDDEPAATGELTVVMVDADGAPAPWPDHARALLDG